MRLVELKIAHEFVCECTHVYVCGCVYVGVQIRLGADSGAVVTTVHLHQSGVGRVPMGPAQRRRLVRMRIYTSTRSEMVHQEMTRPSELRYAYDTIRYGIFTCAQKRTLWLA